VSHKFDSCTAVILQYAV